METKYIVEVKEPYEHPLFQLETSEKFEALLKACLLISDLNERDDIIITEWNDGVENKEGMLIYSKEDGIEAIKQEIKKENDKVLFIVLLGSQYEDTSKGNKVLVTSDAKRAFGLAHELINDESNDEYREKQVIISAVKESKVLEENKYLYENKHTLKDFAAKYNVLIEETAQPRPRNKM